MRLLHHVSFHEAAEVTFQLEKQGVLPAVLFIHMVFLIILLSERIRIRKLYSEVGVHIQGIFSAVLQ